MGLNGPGRAETRAAGTVQGAVPPATTREGCPAGLQSPRSVIPQASTRGQAGCRAIQGYGGLTGRPCPLQPAQLFRELGPEPPELLG